MMKILKYKKDRNNTYKVYFDEDLIINLYDDVIIKYNLLTLKNISKELFDEIVKYNSFLDGYYNSIKYINKKMRTEKEIRRYLKKNEICDKDIDEIVCLLYKSGYINKDVYMKAYINDKYNLSNVGPLKVKKELVELGYNEIDIIDYLNGLDWNSRISCIVDKKIKLNHKLSNNALKTKIMNDLVKLGYSKESVLDYLNFVSFKGDNDILIKELNRVKKKYSFKYSGNELEYKVISYLYKKGFDIGEIKRCYDEN